MPRDQLADALVPLLRLQCGRVREVSEDQREDARDTGDVGPEVSLTRGERSALGGALAPFGTGFVVAFRNIAEKCCSVAQPT